MVLILSLGICSLSVLCFRSVSMLRCSLSHQFHRDYRRGQKHAAHSSVAKLHVKTFSEDFFLCVIEPEGSEKILRFNAEIFSRYSKGVETLKIIRVNKIRRQ